MEAQTITHPAIANWVDHNIIWNVERGIHLQNQTTGAKTAGYVIVNNTVAVRMLGGNPSMHGPYGVVKNSDALFQDTLIADNLFLLQDESARFKPVDFESDSSVRRLVENNLTAKRFEDLGLVGGTEFPAALLPAEHASQVKDKGKVRNPPNIHGLAVPNWNREQCLRNLGSPWEAGESFSQPTRHAAIPGGTRHLRFPEFSVIRQHRNVSDSRAKRSSAY